MLSGVLSNYELPHKVRIERDIAKYGGDKEVIQVEMSTLESILGDDTYEVDLLSIDTEGSECKILKDINFNSIKINVIVLENNFKSMSFRKLLEPKGYVLFKQIAQDEIYVLNSYLSGSIIFSSLLFRTKEILNRLIIKFHK